MLEVLNGLKNTLKMRLIFGLHYVSESFKFGFVGGMIFGGLGCAGDGALGTAFCEEICKACVMA